jgi:hypothetical protein
VLILDDVEYQITDTELLRDADLARGVRRAHEHGSATQDHGTRQTPDH